IEAEGDLLAHGIDVMPGKPAALGFVGGMPVLAVPGDPGSAYGGCEAFLRPLLYRLRGLGGPGRGRARGGRGRKTPSRGGGREGGGGGGGGVGGEGGAGGGAAGGGAAAAGGEPAELRGPRGRHRAHSGARGRDRGRRGGRVRAAAAAGGDRARPPLHRQPRH